MLVIVQVVLVLTVILIITRRLSQHPPRRRGCSRGLWLPGPTRRRGGFRFHQVIVLRIRELFIRVIEIVAVIIVIVIVVSAMWVVVVRMRVTQVALSKLVFAVALLLSPQAFIVVVVHRHGDGEPHRHRLICRGHMHTQDK